MSRSNNIPFGDSLSCHGEVHVEKSIHTRQQQVLRSVLRQLRTDAGLRQVDLAERLGEPQSFVSKYESGERRLDVVELAEICRGLGISLAAFVRRFEDALDETQP